MKLNNLKPAEGSTHSRRRIGRGPGSGLGGTSTRGHKGAKARSGYKRKIGFEGGQMPLQRWFRRWSDASPAPCAEGWLQEHQPQGVLCCEPLYTSEAC